METAASHPNRPEGILQQTLFKQNQTQANTVAQLDAEIEELESRYRQTGRVETPESQLAKARRRQESARKKGMKVLPAIQKAQRALQTHHKRLNKLQAQEAKLTEHLARLQADNTQNSDPVPIILRMDAGFCARSASHP